MRSRGFLLIALSCALCPGAGRAQDYSPWGSLLSHRPGVTEQAALVARSGVAPVWHFQHIEDGCGQVNLDYYPVTVTRLPVVDGRQLDGRGLLDYVRGHLDDFLDHERASVRPMAAVDAQKWASQNPLGAVLSFDLKVRGVRFEGGSVVVTDAQPTYWRFSTAMTGPDWAHPVSGNREFGYLQNGGTVTLYTRGADRANWAIADYWIGQRFLDFVNQLAARFGLSADAPLLPVLFDEGDMIWRHFQETVAAFVNSHGGAATVAAPNVARPDWASAPVQAVYRPGVNWATDYGLVVMNAPEMANRRPVAINDARQVLLTAETPVPAAWLWSDRNANAAPDPAEIRALAYAGQPVVATGLSEGGTVVGFTGARYSGANVPLIFKADGTVVEVRIPGASGARFESIAGENIIGGTAEFPTQGTNGSFRLQRGFIWTDQNNNRQLEPGELQFVSPQVEGRDTEVFSVAEGGWAAGSVDTGARVAPALWQNGALSSLPQNRGGVAWSVNARGGAAGQRNRTGGIEGFFFRDGTLTTMPSLAAGNSFALSLNNRSITVGNAQGADGELRGIVWNRAGVRALDDVTVREPGRRITQAFSINKSGLVAVMTQGPSGPRPGVAYRFDYFTLFANSLPALCH